MKALFTGQNYKPENRTIGDCAPVARSIVTGIDFDSGALLRLFADFSVPGFGSGEAQITGWSNNPGEEGGHTTTIKPSGEFVVSDDPAFDVPFETTYGLNLSKLGLGSCDVAIRVRADYGTGASGVLLDELIQSIGSTAADEMPPVGRSVLVPSLKAIQEVIPTADQTPVVTLHVEQLDNALGSVEILANSQWYAKQIFPKVESIEVLNCEAATPPADCPSVTRVFVQFGANPPTSWDWTVPDPPFVIGIGTPVNVIFEFDGPLPDIPATTVSPPPLGAVSWNPVNNQLSWQFSQPPGDTFPKVEDDDCLFEFDDPTTTGVP